MVCAFQGGVFGVVEITRANGHLVHHRGSHICKQGELKVTGKQPWSGASSDAVREKNPTSA